MKELIELNRYVHDFTSAMWVCGSILIWLLCREAQATRDAGTAETLLRLARKLVVLTVPSLILTLATGGVRAVTFTQYEHVGPITNRTIAMLAVKHILFAALVGWGIGVHWRSRVLRRKISAAA